MWWNEIQKEAGKLTEAEEDAQFLEACDQACSEHTGESTPKVAKQDDLISENASLKEQLELLKSMSTDGRTFLKKWNSQCAQNAALVEIVHLANGFYRDYTIEDYPKNPASLKLLWERLHQVQVRRNHE